MIGAGLGGGALVYVAIGNTARAEELAVDRAKARAVANAVARQMSQGASAAELARLQGVLPNDQLIVERGRVRIYTGPRRAGRRIEVTVSAPFRGGRVTLVDHESPAAAQAPGAIVAGLAVAALLILTAVVVSSAITRSVRGPVERAIDVSDRIAAGDLTARMGRTGPDTLSTLGSALDDMAERLEREDIERRRFLADVAHEVATPLHTIVAYATAIADGTVAGDAEFARAERAITGASARVDGLLTALREMARLDLFSTVHIDEMDPAEVCGEVVDRFESAAAQKGVALTVDVPAATIRSDRWLLDTVLDNLVANAIRYTPAGGSIAVRGRRSADGFEISVADTGIGIAEDDQRRIFDHLYRVDNARARATGGLGLGLTIARRAAEALGGTIAVTSTLGAGSTFTLSIAVPDAEA